MRHLTGSEAQLAGLIGAALAATRLEPRQAWWVRRAYKAGGAAWCSNVACVLDGDAAAVAAALGEQLQMKWPGRVAGDNGFINFWLDDAMVSEQLKKALQQGPDYGCGTALQGKRLNVEFVSADPSGPLTFSAGRIAICGEALCRLLQFQGASVTREFYVNDDLNSSKMQLLGESVAAHYLRGISGGEMPEGTLRSEFVCRVAREVREKEGNAHVLVPDQERVAGFAQRAQEASVTAQRQTLNRLGVHFDVWTSEAALRRAGRIQATMEKLEQAGHAYWREGALWLHSTAFGDLHDRPLLRPAPEGTRATYLAADLAYHLFKLERGFEGLINIWTLEHRPYVVRTQAGLQAAGAEAGRLEVLLCAGAQVLRDGVPPRNEEYEPTMDEVLGQVEAETMRWCVLSCDWEQVAEMELDGTSRDDESNPAYAALLVPHRLATLCGELEARLGTSSEPPASITDLSPVEAELARLIALWPEEAETAALERRPQWLTAFSGELAKTVRQVTQQVRPHQGTAAEKAGRLLLLRAARVTAQNALHLLGMTGK